MRETAYVSHSLTATLHPGDAHLVPVHAKLSPVKILHSVELLAIR